MATTPPRPLRPVSERMKQKLLRMAKSNSESFARSMMACAASLDSTDSSGEDATTGIEYVDSLNGIDVYEDVSHANNNKDAAVSTRLRSFCHIEVDIQDIVRRLATSASSPAWLPGIVDTLELCSVLTDPDEASPEKEYGEHAGVNWFVLNRESTRDSVTSSSSHGSRLSSGVGLMPHRDSAELGEEASLEFVVLSYQGIFKHRGRRGWVQWCQSIEMPSFPASSRSLKRGVLYSSGIIAVESATRPGQVSVGYSMGVDLSVCDGRERRFVENAVWKRVMRLAALKKSTLRESLTRTLSIVSIDMVESDPDMASFHRERSLTRTQPRTQPECEPMKDWDPPRKAVDVQKPKKNRQRAQTEQLAPSPKEPYRHHQSLFREPSSLEFRLTFYNEPDDIADELRPSACTSYEKESSIVSRFSSVFKSSKAHRPTSRSVSGIFV